MRRVAILILVLAAAVCSFVAADAKQKPDLNAQVFAAESSFAQTLAARDLTAFERHVSQEAVFFGGRDVMRGRAAVVAGWKPLFDGPEAPFSWRPEVVEVLESGTLALSTGPVAGPDGRVIARFQSIWRLESDGKWRVVFDKGCAVCDSAKAE